MDQEGKMTYSEAFQELQQIVSELERSEIGVDLLEIRVERAAKLLKICREKLYSTEKNVTEVLRDLENQVSDTPGAAEED